MRDAINAPTEAGSDSAQSSKKTYTKPSHRVCDMGSGELERLGCRRAGRPVNPRGPEEAQDRQPSRRPAHTD
jgi:hypothetical protein